MGAHWWPTPMRIIHAHDASMKQSSENIDDGSSELKDEPKMVVETSGSAQLSEKDLESRRARIRQLFSTLDVNKTGFLDHDKVVRRFDELSRPRNRVSSQTHTDDKSASIGAKTKSKSNGPAGSAVMYARELVQECDKTQDGKISFAEFEQFVNRKEMELRNVFNQIDSSGDNTLSTSELKDFVKAAGIHVTDDEVHRLVKRLDRDGSGVITYDEWRDFLLLLPHKVTPANIFKFYHNIYNVDVNSDSMPFPEQLDDEELVKRYRYFICGGLSGAVSRTVTAPLDRLKVLLVTQTSSGVGNRAQPGAITEGIKRIYREGGIRCFYRGNGINILKIAPESGVKFLTFETVKKAIAGVEGVDHSDHISVPGRFLAGGTAGLISQFSIYPLETIKTRIMAQISTTTATSGSLNSSTSASTTTTAPKSPNKFIPVHSNPSSPARIIQSASFSSQHLQHPTIPRPHTSHPFNPAAQLSTSIPPKPSSSLMFNTIRSMWAEGGIRTFYRGCVPSLIGIVPYAGIDLGIYETLRSTAEARLRARTGNKRAKLSSGYLLGFGMVSAACGATIMYPLSVVRTRLQAQGTPSHPATYTNTFDVIRRTYAREGVFGFYRGLTPTLMKVLPAVSISYVVYERSKAMF
ncbi:mitochondrial carrier domain-containing protein [Phlyctochytrium arcticum]|nr:mitochondrial carrier domain-containing protein [Phlyctochytrium arcticum]